MQFLTKNSLAIETAKPVSDSLIDMAHKAGFSKYADRLTNLKRANLAELQNRFTEVSTDELNALTDDSEVTHHSLADFDFESAADEQVIMRVLELAGRAKQLSPKIWKICRGEQTEWALIGACSINGDIHHFMLARWGEDLEELSTLIRRRDSRLFLEKNAQEAQAYIEESRLRRTERRDKLVNVGIGIVFTLVGLGIVAGLGYVLFSAAPHVGGWLSTAVSVPGTPARVLQCTAIFSLIVGLANLLMAVFAPSGMTSQYLKRAVTFIAFSVAFGLVVPTLHNYMVQMMTNTSLLPLP